MPCTMPLMRSIPSLSMRSAEKPSDSAQSRTRGSTSVASSGASTWMYSQPSETSSRTSERPISAASANIANASGYAPLECRGLQKP
jgi:hypothetical protein